MAWEATIVACIFLSIKVGGQETIFDVPIRKLSADDRNSFFVALQKEDRFKKWMLNDSMDSERRTEAERRIVYQPCTLHIVDD